MSNLCFFEEKGIKIQYDSRSIAEAVNNLKKSCHICYTQGKHVDCDRCRIKGAHHVVMEAFEYLHYKKANN